MDAGSNVFENAQIYVALSRVRMSSGLHLLDLDADKILCSETVYDEYCRLRKHCPYQLDDLPVSHLMFQPYVVLSINEIKLQCITFLLTVH